MRTSSFLVFKIVVELGWFRAGLVVLSELATDDAMVEPGWSCAAMLMESSRALENLHSCSGGDGEQSCDGIFEKKRRWWLEVKEDALLALAGPIYGEGSRACAFAVDPSSTYTYVTESQ
jgi:hypothetical protein